MIDVGSDSWFHNYEKNHDELDHFDYGAFMKAIEKFIDNRTVFLLDSDRQVKELNKGLVDELKKDGREEYQQFLLNENQSSLIYYVYSKNTQNYLKGIPDVYNMKKELMYYVHRNNKDPLGPFYHHDLKAGKNIADFLRKNLIYKTSS